MSTFGATLKKDRERLGLSQEELAKRVGVSQQAVANWESGAAHPRRDRRERLLEVLGPNSELATNPPRFDFVPAKEIEVAMATGKFIRAEAKDQAVGLVSTELQERVRNFDPRRERAELLAQFKDVLPEPLRSHVDKPIRYGQTERRYDYVSSGVIARIIKMSAPVLPAAWRLSVPLLHLAMAVDRNLHAAPTASVMLFILTDDNPVVLRKRIEHTEFDAITLGVKVNITASLQDIANTIKELEALYVTQMEEYEAWLQDIEQQADEAPDLPPDFFGRPSGDVPTTPLKDDDVIF